MNENAKAEPAFPCPVCGAARASHLADCRSCGWTHGKSKSTCEVPARRVCPDCDSPLHPIKLIHDVAGGGHSELGQYTAGEAEKGWFFYPVKGKVRSMMCPACGRILLYGEPSGP